MPGTIPQTPADNETLQQLTEMLACHVSPKTAVVCVGNELRGDDGAGPAVAQLLLGTVPLDVYDTQTAPENFMAKIIRGWPDCIVVVDAMHLGAEPGAFRLMPIEDLTGQGPGTHGPAPLALMHLLQEQLSCHCVVLGIQPADTRFGAPMSQPVRRTVELVSGAFRLLAGCPKC